MGYNPEVHENAKNLQGYQGDARSQKAHIILPKKQVGSASNDIGFERLPDGKYKMHVSAYDKNQWNKKSQELKQLYSKHKIVKHAKKAKYSLKSQTKDAEGNIKIKLRVRG